jgi:uncharacterized membrane protein YfcA|tara:strand:+ start:147 stop:425 length:279 start_codon:yes stop_codon:yes gene_type:complete
MIEGLKVYDQINSVFIFVASVFYALNLITLIKDKDVKGISKLSIIFFSVWNLWTLFFFVQTSEFWWTIAAYVIVAILNVIYLFFMFKYLRKN